MVYGVSIRHETLAGKLGCDNSNLQIFLRRQEGFLHNERNRKSELFLPKAQPPKERISEFSGSHESSVSGHIRDHKKMDRPDSELGKDLRRTGNYVS